MNFVFQSGLSVAFLPPRDHGNDRHAICVDGEGDGGVRELKGCCHGRELRSGVGDGATDFVVVGALGRGVGGVGVVIVGV